MFYGYGHSYEAIHFIDPITWNEANNYVKKISAGKAHLVTISSEEENNLVFDDISSQKILWNMAPWGSGVGPWIGLTRDSLHHWSWVTGEPLIYTSWEPGEPNGEYENRAVFAGRGASAPSRTLIGPNWDDVLPGDVAVNSLVLEYDYIV
jgi:hypothetical protein